jgi:FtsP/CotA-like multicopper oxidase with cupredoxin domain
MRENEEVHLHGHAFPVTAVNGAPVAGALRDTVLVAPIGSATITVDADNADAGLFTATTFSP